MAPGWPAVSIARGFVTARLKRRMAVSAGGYFDRITAMKRPKTAIHARNRSMKTFAIRLNMATS
jgi:hypothetical protein